MSTTTSVPAAACIAPCGSRTAPIRSAMPAMCARAVADVLSMVQRRGDERGDPARLQALHRARDEVVVQRQRELAAGIVGPHGPVAERRVADRQVEGLGQPRLGEVLGADPGVRVTGAGRCGR